MAVYDDVASSTDTVIAAFNYNPYVEGEEEEEEEIASDYVVDLFSLQYRSDTNQL